MIAGAVGCVTLTTLENYVDMLLTDRDGYRPLGRIHHSTRRSSKVQLPKPLQLHALVQTQQVALAGQRAIQTASERRRTGGA